MYRFVSNSYVLIERGTRSGSQAYSFMMRPIMAKGIYSTACPMVWLVDSGVYRTGTSIQNDVLSFGSQISHFSTDMSSERLCRTALKIFRYKQILQCLMCVSGQVRFPVFIADWISKLHATSYGWMLTSRFDDVPWNSVCPKIGGHSNRVQQARSNAFSTCSR